MDYFKENSKIYNQEKTPWTALHKVDIAGSIVLNCTTSRK